MRKYAITQSGITPAGKQITMQIKTDDEEIVKQILEGKPLKAEALNTEVKEVKRNSKRVKSFEAVPQLVEPKKKKKK